MTFVLSKKNYSARIRGLVAVAVLAASSAEAQSPTNSARLELTSGDQPQISTDGGQTYNPIKSAKPLVVDSNHPLALVVSDYNPILYTYSAKEEQKATVSADALDTFIKALQQVFKAGGVPLPGAPPLCKLGALQVNQIDVRAVKQATTALTVLRASYPTWMARLAGEPGPIPLGKDADDYRKMVRGRPGMSATDLTDSFNILATTRTQAIEVEELCPGNPSRTISADSLQTLRGKVSNAGELADIDAVDTLLQQASKLKDEFAQTLDQYSTPFVVDTSEFTAGKDTTVKITIKANSQFDQFLDAQGAIARQQHVGTVTVLVNSHQSIHLGVSAAAIYSFVKNPQYSASSNSSNQLILTQTSNDYNKLSGAVAVNLIPDRCFGGQCYGEFIEPHVQVGIVPDSSKFAIFACLGFIGGSKLDFNVGAIYQKTTVG